MPKIYQLTYVENGRVVKLIQEVSQESKTNKFAKLETRVANNLQDNKSVEVIFFTRQKILASSLDESLQVNIQLHSSELFQNNKQ